MKGDRFLVVNFECVCQLTITCIAEKVESIRVDPGMTVMVKTFVVAMITSQRTICVYDKGNGRPRTNVEKSTLM